jgi:nischarin
MSLKQFSSLSRFQLHAISTRLRLPCSSFELQNSAFDFSNILDFCSQLETLCVVPAEGNFSTKDEFLQQLINPIATSNILPSTLTFDLSPFTHLTNLELCAIVCANIGNYDTVKATVTNLTVVNTRVQNVQQILLPESIHDSAICPSQSWSQVKIANFGDNDIWQIDNAISLLPNVEVLHLNNNRLRNVSNLKSLYHLSHLNLSGNLIESLQNWQMEIGNVGTLNLSGNKLKSLRGLSRLRSLISLDLSWNEIEELEEIDEIALLPIIENVSLNGNLLALEVDYRARILSRFDDRCSEIVLDNEKARSSEIDKAMVLAALRKTKILQ